MVGDLIQQVVRPLKEERVATGEVDGFDIELQKRRYGNPGRKNCWRVNVIATNDGQTAHEAGLDHKEAEEEFEYLLEKYDLEEQDV